MPQAVVFLSCDVFGCHQLGEQTVVEMVAAQESAIIGRNYPLEWRYGTCKCLLVILSDR